MARNRRVVVIRATPMVGKTTLLRLLGHHIVMHERDLEPVYIEWRRQNNPDRGKLPYEKYLQREASEWRDHNKAYRPNNPNARMIYLIDEAQGSYEEEHFWGTTLKHPNTRSSSLFVLVCLYGAHGISRTLQPHIESQAQRMDRIHRVELRPNGNKPFMLFRPEETREMIRKWALQHKFDLLDGTCEYIHNSTDGHPGVIGLVLLHFRVCYKNVSTEQHPRDVQVNN
jgi:hypothetical protein